ncbi:MAG TPA: DUF1587 domain-containing protein, partial [Vicinamibacterales bacterium]|nr:DUF1587 domain-containing protein [Vicinamibacterales bacterium]
MRRLAPPLLVTGLFCTVLALRVGLAVGPAATSGPQEAAPAPDQDTRTTPRTAPDLNATIEQYCFECHDDKPMRGGLTLARFDVARAEDHPEIAEKMVRKLRAGLMPPKRAPQPNAAIRLALATALEARLDRAAMARPNPGRRVFQRLNRAEYAAAIRALFGLDIDVSAYLPADTISASFDNIADVQTP